MGVIFNFSKQKTNDFYFLKVKSLNVVL